MALVTGVGSNGMGVAVFTLTTNVQNVSYNAAGGASTQSAAFQAKTEAILVTTTTSDVRIAIGSNPTASSSTTLIPKPAAMIFAVPPGGKIAVLGNDATTGAICVTELATTD